MTLLRRLSFDLSYLLGRTPWDTGVSPPELLAFLDATPPGRALDLGCGTGTNAITMARRGWQVTAVDLSRRAIRAARRKARAAGLEIDFRLGDASMPEGICGPFDMALDIGCFHSLSASGQARYADTLSRLLRPGAVFLLYGHLRPDPQDPWTWLTPDNRTRLFGGAFDIVQTEEGTDHQRPSVWITMRRNP
jgi:cyclopropane fatty-acyl-phospholipid synthase-like methyltransferase